MTPGQEMLVRAVLIGAGATAVLDLWALALQRLFDIPSADFRLFGRWVGHIPRGRFLHQSIAAAAPVQGELAIGWVAHYAIGIAFAALLLAICGLGWARDPSPLPALIVGIATVVAPFFVMQPAIGAGIAAARTPNPAKARLRSLVTHMVFGVGLYLSALLTASLLQPSI